MTNFTDSPLLKQIRETILRLTDAPQRVVTPPDQGAERTRQAIRLLARSRVSQLLRQLRAGRGFSYAQVSEQTGLSQQTLFDIEYKDRRVMLDELKALALCYGVSPNDILGVDIE